MKLLKNIQLREAYYILEDTREVVFNSFISVILLLNLVFIKIISLNYLEVLYMIIFCVYHRFS